MTTLIRPSEPWVVQPGWGIHVDLTPPEILTSRQIRVLRQVIVSALVVVLVACTGGYFTAAHQRSTAEDALAAAQARNAQLIHEAAQPAYTGVTRVQGALKEVQAQLATLLTGDVELDRVFTVMVAALPTGASFTSASVKINLAGVNGPGPAGGVTSSSPARIGDVTLSGHARSLNDVSLLVQRLQTVRGLVDIVPTSNTRQADGAQFNITLGLDDRVLSHRFDVKGGK